MNYVGQLAETVFVTVKELYKGLNPATLTGGIDVIVVRQPDGSLQCSPFHVRFGKLGVLRSREKVVDIEINGEPVELHMKLGDNGEAFFVEESEDLEERLPAHLCTSPIPMVDVEDHEAPDSPPCPGSRKKKRRRRRARSDAHREEASSSSDEREPAEAEGHKDEAHLAILSSKSVYYSLSEEPQDVMGNSQSRELYPYSDGECAPESVFYNRASSPKSDSELLMKSIESSGPQMQWNWGAFPKVCVSDRPAQEVQHTSAIPLSENTHFRTIRRQDSFDADPDLQESCVTILRPEPRPGGMWRAEDSPPPFTTPVSTSLPPSEYDPPGTWGSELGTGGLQVVELPDPPPDGGGGVPQDDLQGAAEGKACGQLDASCLACVVVRGEDIPTTATESSPNGQVTGMVLVKEGAEEGGTCENQSGFLETPTKEDTQEKKRSKRSQHLGPADIYLDDLSKLDPEKASLYFPKSDMDISSRGVESGSQSGNQSPQSVGSGAMDSGTDYLSDSTGDLCDVTLSLCGRVVDTSHIDKAKFMEHIVSFQDLAENPGIIDDPNLVICVNSKYYNWAVAAPMILSMQAFQKNLPKATVDQLVKQKMPKRSGRWWFWRRKDMDSNQAESQQGGEGAGLEVFEPCAGPSAMKGGTFSDDDDLGQMREDRLTETQSTTHCIAQMYRKSLRLSTEQIERLNLREGANQVVFSVTTQYQGTCRCEAAIYLWSWDDKVIISDIDGTITKSDALGHILPQLGKDWTHHGIAKLYHKIHQNGYKFLYCSARAIGMADITKGYLHWVNDKGTVLPKGPVLLAPSSLFSALHREVIEKKPEVFKVACLSDIRDLFSPQKQPFYAAFGNRTNDAYAYKQVGVPEMRIFTVNPKGELIQEKTKGNKLSYSRLSELVEHVFPLVARGRASSLDCPDYSHFTFWRELLPPLDLSQLA
ncbi:phosphatidate phosphatase LPIN2-like [Brienomyrus brachyistius]|uniref:phosphatidate phosphatase LPIN2-like n=1 Tax=Brienomyrus brachyistius TaxID=42636 RepID=UPI0020B3799F|nr:phosphatidate phosphatase LPIN2-like [Brienomyrus brachyistius]XP_048858437.1 phosphatidate phosphatase LPIN2-like [Brienomyrus brachyistius]